VGAPPMGFWPNRVEKYLLSQLKVGVGVGGAGMCLYLCRCLGYRVPAHWF
jgi:hypothetical protein